MLHLVISNYRVIAQNVLLQEFSASQGCQIIKQLRARDFIYNGVKIYANVPEDHCLKLVVKYL